MSPMSPMSPAARPALLFAFAERGPADGGRPRAHGPSRATWARLHGPPRSPSLSLGQPQVERVAVPLRPAGALRLQSRQLAKRPKPARENEGARGDALPVGRG